MTKRGWPGRLEQICNEIRHQSADIICLQDVPDEEHCKLLAKECGYDFFYFVKQSSTCELAILSKLPFLSKRSFSEAIIVTVKVLDFNYEEGSSVHNFLLGKQSLYGEEAVPYWEDLAIVHRDITGINPKPTLDLSSNPRWKSHGYKECAGTRIDLILLKYSYPKSSTKLKAFHLFGTEVSSDTGYCASDHYGVFAELDFKDM